MIYTLMHFDTPLIVFSAERQAEANIKIIEAHEENKELFPIDLAEVSESGIESWIKHRSIPKNRAYVDTLLSTLGLSINRPLDIISVSKGLSLNDCYWFKQEGSSDSFDSVNLYDNRFSRVLGQIAFTGYGSSNVSGLTSSPEFTTNGMLPKCWRRIDGKILLYKGGTMGASNKRAIFGILCLPNWKDPWSKRGPVQSLKMEEYALLYLRALHKQGCFFCSCGENSSLWRNAGS